MTEPTLKVDHDRYLDHVTWLALFAGQCRHHVFKNRAVKEGDIILFHETMNDVETGRTIYTTVRYVTKHTIAGTDIWVVSLSRRVWPFGLDDDLNAMDGSLMR